MRLDDDAYLDISPQSIGEIKLVIFHTAVPEVTAKKQQYTYFQLPHLEKVHERSKKAIAHRVKYVAALTSYKFLKFNDDKQLWQWNSKAMWDVIDPVIF